MSTHSSIHAWEISWTEDPWGRELDMTEQLTLSSAVISTLSIISFLHSSQQHSEESCVIAPILSLRKLMLQFSHSVMSNSLTSHGLLHARLPCPSPTIGACSNSCPLSRWCHPIISSSVVPFPSYLQSFPAPGFFSNESVLCIRWPKYWSFSFNISPFNEYSGLISFRINWLDHLAARGTLKSLPRHHSSKASILWPSAFLWSNSHIHTWLLEKP